MHKGYTNQHIVPKRYLDRFGMKEDKRTIIGTRTVNKGNVKFFIDSTANVGYIKNYYDVTDKNDPKYWEHYFAREIDGLCGRDMENVISKVMLSQKNAIVLSNKDKNVLSKVIIAQLMRIPSSLNYMKNQLYPRVSKQVKKDVALSLPWFMYEKYKSQLEDMEFSEQDQKELLLNHAFDPKNFERYCSLLQEGIWVVCVNIHRNTVPFITSDNPVLVESARNKETGMFRNGLADPGTCIFYPLSPSIAVAIYSRQGIVSRVADKYDGRKILVDEIKYIVRKNIKIIEQAYHHSFIPQPLYDVLCDSQG